MERVARVAAVLASHNEHKLAELRDALPDWQLELMDDLEFPPEVGDTYYENAFEKARAGRAVASPHVWVLGEDSGIEIEALGGGPGVHSARWAGGDHVRRVLDALRGVPRARRRARYVCELVALAPGGDELRGAGVVEGRIAEEARGTEGFGFDPVFVPDGADATVAELGSRWKSRNSHRALAARQLLERVTDAP